MVEDPSSTLGISHDATKDEIKSAYRKAAKKYHPDLHPDDPEAAAKMNEVNQAYDMLMNPERYQNQNTYSTQPSQPAYTSYSEDGYMNMDDLFRMFGFYGNPYARSPFSTAEEYIRNHQYATAIQHLESYQASLRNDRWYYLYAIANEGAGHHDTAVESIHAAVQLNPYNTEYVQYMNQLEGRKRSAYTYKSSPAVTGMRILSGIFLLNLLFLLLQFLFLGFAW